MQSCLIPAANNRSPASRFRILSSALILLVITVPVSGQDKQPALAALSAADIFPETSVIYAEMPQADRLVETLLKHQAVKFALELPQVQQAMKTPQYNMGMGLLKSIEIQLDMTWQQAIQTLTAGGVYVAVDASTNGLCVLLRAKDAESLDKILGTLLRISKDFGREIPSSEFEGVTVYKGDNNVGYGAVREWLVFTNKGELGKTVVRNLLKIPAAGDTPLSSKPSFQSAAKRFSKTQTINGYVDIEFLRDAGAAEGVFRGLTNNPLEELLLGGLLSNLQKTSHLNFSALLDQDVFRIDLATPHENNWVETRQYYFGAQGKGRAPALIKAADTVFTLSTYRDLSEMWLRAGDLYSERAQDQLAEADSTLSTFFAGRDFGEDILGSLGPQLQLVVNRQDFSKMVHTPKIRFPSFALIAPMTKPDEVTGEFRRIFQSLIGFLNVVGAMEGGPQLDMDSERRPTGRLLFSNFVPDKNLSPDDDAPVQFNFTPSLALMEKKMAISSSRALAEDIFAGPKQSPVQNSVNTAMHMNIGMLRNVLNDNREQLIANNMLEKGHDHTAAAAEIDVLFTILQLFRNADLQLKNVNQHLELGLNIHWASSPRVTE